MQAQIPRQNGSNGSTTNDDAPRDELDMYQQILRPSQQNSILKTTNLGHGKYDDDYLWQQIRSYRKGLFAYIAFGDILSQRAVHETKVLLAREGFDFYDESRGEPKSFDPLREEDIDERESSWNAELRYGEEIWQRMGDWDQPLSKEQVAAVIDKTGVDTEWLPIYWQMVAGRHEASRSLDAELLRDMLTGIKHYRQDESAADGLAQIMGGA